MDDNRCGIKRSADEFLDNSILDDEENLSKRPRLNFVSRPGSQSIIIPISLEESVLSFLNTESQSSTTSDAKTSSSSSIRISIPIESDLGEERQSTNVSPRPEEKCIEIINVDDDDSDDGERCIQQGAVAEANTDDVPEIPRDALAELRAISAQRFREHKNREAKTNSSTIALHHDPFDVDEAIRRSLVDLKPEQETIVPLTSQPSMSSTEGSNVHTLSTLSSNENGRSARNPYSLRGSKIESPNMEFDSFEAQVLKNEIKNIRNQDKPLGFVSRLNFTMTVGKIRTLFGRNWLSDEVINTYLSIVVEKTGGTNMAYLESYWCSQIVKHGPSGVRKWKQTGDLLRRLQAGDVEYVFAPINFDDSHWCLGLLAPRKRVWYVLDSAGHDEVLRTSEFAQIMQLWLEQHTQGPWRLEIPITLSNAHQDFKYDSHNCGVLYAELLCSGKSLDYVVNTRVGTAGISNYRDAILMALFRDIPLSLNYTE